MPQVVSTNTGAACMMIGEKASALIRHYRHTGRADWPSKTATRRHSHSNITSLLPTDATSAYYSPSTTAQPQQQELELEQESWQTRNTTEYPTTQELLGYGSVELIDIHPETTTRSENEIDVDGFHSFQSNWKVTDDKHSTFRSIVEKLLKANFVNSSYI
jgi:hypothetical protein